MAILTIRCDSCKKVVPTANARINHDGEFCKACGKEYDLEGLRIERDAARRRLAEVQRALADIEARIANRQLKD